ncbi:flagellar biosynthesis protein FlhF, partial [Paenibacillus sp. 28ISP30-2]|nr:flagellar biosynthesis protein FlhF [Paenibacillus sp. 28ISP30-2]
MRVKRYVVDTMPEAMMQIRGDFGTDAVILSTKEMKIGGFMGMFGKKKIEVVAAVEEQQLQKPRRVQPSQQQSVEAFLPINAPEQQEAPSSPVVPRQAAPEAYRRVTQMTNGSKEGLADLMAAAEQVAPGTERSSYGAGYSVEAENEAFNNKAAVPKKVTSNELFKQASEASIPDKMGAEENQSLLYELREMKAMMTRISRNSTMENTWPEPLQEICERMLEQEVERDLLEHWLERVYERRREHPSDPESFDWEQALRAEVTGFIRARLD